MQNLTNVLTKKVIVRFQTPHKQCLEQKNYFFGELIAE